MSEKVDGVEVFCAYTEIADTYSLVPNPRKQIELLAKIIKAQGWRAPITVSNRSGFVVRGHGRLLAAQRAGLMHVPIDKQDYKDEAAEYADLVADNRIAELAGQNNSILKDLLLEFDDGSNDMELFGFDEEALEKLMTEVSSSKEKPEVELTPELFEAHNYLVLYFDNELDWQHAQKVFQIKTVTDKMGDKLRNKDGSPGRKGVGRIMPGKKVLELIDK